MLQESITERCLRKIKIRWFKRTKQSSNLTRFIYDEEDKIWFDSIICQQNLIKLGRMHYVLTKAGEQHILSLLKSDINKSKCKYLRDFFNLLF